MATTTTTTPPMTMMDDSDPRSNPTIADAVALAGLLDKLGAALQSGGAAGLAAAVRAARAEGVRVASLVAVRKREAIAVLRSAAEAAARNAEAKARGLVESELRRLEQRMQHQLDIVAQQFGVSDDDSDSAAGAGIEELRELIATEKAKLAAIEDLGAISQAISLISRHSSVILC
jgi:hypothetical protein